MYRKALLLFIDGLDHAARSKDARNSFLSQLPRPKRKSGMIFILSWSDSL